MEIIGKVR